jgi:hypothetical protein
MAAESTDPEDDRGRESPGEDTQPVPAQPPSETAEPDDPLTEPEPSEGPAPAGGGAGGSGG